MADLIFGDVEQAPVGIQRWGGAKWLLQPIIIASCKGLERETACFAEVVKVVLEWLVAEKTASLVAECEGGLPRCEFQW
jgi:hypothetical protein